MGEVTYLWADPNSGKEQVALSAIVQAMYEKGALAIARWVSRDGTDPKMGVLKPAVAENVDYFLWVQVPQFFKLVDLSTENLSIIVIVALCRRRAQFSICVPRTPHFEEGRSDREASLPSNRRASRGYGELRGCDGSHGCGQKRRGRVGFFISASLQTCILTCALSNRQSWFDTRLSYNPAIHRTKQAQFHSAIVPDLNTHPLPPPHPELLKYLHPPRRLLKRAADAIEECKEAFNVKEGKLLVLNVIHNDLGIDEWLCCSPQARCPSEKRRTCTCARRRRGNATSRHHVSRQTISISIKNKVSIPSCWCGHSKPSALSKSNAEARKRQQRDRA